MGCNRPFDEEQLKAIASFFASRGDVAAAYLFPNARQRHSGLQTSADLGILLHPLVEEARYEEKRIDIIHSLSVEMNSADIRVVILNDASANFCNDLIQSGEVIYFGSPKLLDDFENHIRTGYLRSLHSWRNDTRRTGQLS